MKQIKNYIVFGVAIASLATAYPVVAQVGWNVAVGGVYGGGYGGWRPAAYGPGWRGGWAYGGGYYGAPYGYAGYYAPPVVYVPPVAYAPPPPPLVMAAQAQPAVWYFCQTSGKYFPYVQDCESGWQAQPAIPPSGSVQH